MRCFVIGIWAYSVHFRMRMLKIPKIWLTHRIYYKSEVFPHYSVEAIIGHSVNYAESKLIEISTMKNLP